MEFIPLAKEFSFNLQLSQLKSSKHLWQDVFGISNHLSKKIGLPRSELSDSLRRGIQHLNKREFMNAAVYFGKLDNTFEVSLLVLACRSLVGDNSVAMDFSLFLGNPCGFYKSCNPAVLFFSLSIIMNQKAKTFLKDLNEASRFARFSYGYGLAFLAILESYPEFESWRELITEQIMNLNNSVWSLEPVVDLKESPSQKRWKDAKRDNGSKNKAMDELMKLIGLESVKDMFLNIYDSVEINKRRGMSIKDKRLNVCFTGNPGTGIC